MSEIEDNNKLVVRRIFEEMWNLGNLAVADEIFAQPESVRKYVKEFLTAFPNLQHKVEDLIAEGDRVVARFFADGTHMGQWKHYLPKGNPIHYTGVTIAHLEGGKIVQHRTWWDTLEVVEQISGESR